MAQDIMENLRFADPDADLRRAFLSGGGWTCTSCLDWYMALHLRMLSRVKVGSR